MGFNAGHTSEIFLEFAKNSQMAAFDINSHYYTDSGVEFMKCKYPGRFQFIEGDSQLTIPDFHKNHPDATFDLIYVDGGHTFECCLNDILNFKALAHENTILWIDDYHFPDVKKAVEQAIRLRIIENVKSQSAKEAFLFESTEKKPSL